ncbi:hypothetical protein ACFMKY_12575 [Pseudomonas protegens]|uniref:hypothetical protein n=1 Tax=Pseudomonas protegens TaxID=380021 RepID=UPI00366A99A9
MLARLNGQELHFFGTPKAFNAMARAIRKGRHGDSQSMPLEQEQSSFSTVFLSCSGQSSRIWIEHSEVHIQYAEASKNRLYPCLSMPAETAPGALFFIDKRHQDHPPLLTDDSLSLVLHVIANDADA